MNTDQSLEAACQAVSENLKSMKDGDRLEKRTLMAIIQDRHEDASKLLNIVERRNMLSLYSVEGGKESPPQPFSIENEHP